MLSRIIKLLKKLLQTYRDDKHFSVTLANARLQESIANLFHLKKAAQQAKKRKDKYIVDTLSKIVLGDLQEYQGSYAEIQNHNVPIFVCWWSGIENAPDLVKICVRSIQAAASNHPVILIDSNNFHEYLDIPDYIIDHVNSKRMCLANFSDYLRFSLLNRYGGMWIDSTVFCSSEIPEVYFEMPLFTCNSSSGTDYFSNGKWTGFVFAGTKGHPLFGYIQSAFETYWKKEDRSIDYLLLDYLIYFAYTNLEIVKRDIDAVPINNLHRNDLRAAMNRREPAEKLNEYLYVDTCFNKLSWREKFSTTDGNGKETVYAAFMKQK